MKRHITIALLVPVCFLWAGTLSAQTSKQDSLGQKKSAAAGTAKKDTTKKAPVKTWFDKYVKIGQSTATSEQQSLPARFNITFPDHKGASYLVDIGVSIQDMPKVVNGLLSFIGEYHRNTLTDSVQNNLQLGIGFHKILFHFDGGNSTLFLIADPQYSWDGVAKKNSVQSNVLLTPHWRPGKFHLGTPIQANDTSHTMLFSLFAGSQLQNVFPSDTTALHGFKLRVLSTGMASYSFNRHHDFENPLITIFASYSIRSAVINRVGDGEKWTHLLNTGINYVIAAKPLKISIGGSFVEGSDYFSGMKAQQYFLVSLNVLK